MYDKSISIVASLHNVAVVAMFVFANHVVTDPRLKQQNWPKQI